MKDCSDASAPLGTAGPGEGARDADAALRQAPVAGGNKTVFIIVNNDAQIDQEQLSSLLGKASCIIYGVK